MNRYRLYSRYLREELGGRRVQKVTINAGFTCPNRDGAVGRGGCTFCVNEAFSPSYCRPSASVSEQVEAGIAFHRGGRYAKADSYLAYFQTFSNTYKPLADLKKIYAEALADPRIVGLVVGTRPDCVDEAKLDFFAELAREKYVILEYGVESVFDRTLERVNRGHDFAAARRAIEATAAREIRVGAHFIVGLPGEGREEALETARIIGQLPLSTIKFHQLQLFRGTAMEADWRANPDDFRFYGVEEYVELMVDVLELLPPTLVVERFMGEAPERYLVDAGAWPVRNERFVQLLHQRLEERDTFQGAKYQ